MHDLVIRNGMIVDGTGCEPTRGDLASLYARVIKAARSKGDADEVKHLEAKVKNAEAHAETANEWSGPRNLPHSTADAPA